MLMQTSKGSRVSVRKSSACSIFFFFLRSAKLIRDLCLVALRRPLWLHQATFKVKERTERECCLGFLWDSAQNPHLAVISKGGGSACQEGILALYFYLSDFGQRAPALHLHHYEKVTLYLDPIVHCFDLES